MVSSAHARMVSVVRVAKQTLTTVYLSRAEITASVTTRSPATHANVHRDTQVRGTTMAAPLFHNRYTNYAIFCIRVGDRFFVRDQHQRLRPFAVLSGHLHRRRELIHMPMRRRLHGRTVPDAN